MPHAQRGHSLVEMIAALTVLVTLTGLGVPWLRAYQAESRLLGAGQEFRGEFRRARSIAVRSLAQTAIRFERGADGSWFYSTYMDGNHNGVLAADIRRGVDRRIGGPRRLDAGERGVRVGILPERSRDPARHGARSIRRVPSSSETPRCCRFRRWARLLRERSTWPAR